jgi:hypothetical protein
MAAVKAIMRIVASVLLVSGCQANNRPPPTIGAPEPCDPSQVRLVAGRSGPAAGTMYLTFTAVLVAQPPCLIATWPPVDISDGGGRLIAQGPGDATGSPGATLLDRVREFHLGWASWCGPDPIGPLTAHVRLIPDEPSTLVIPDGFGASGCQGVPTIVFVEPGW